MTEHTHILQVDTVGCLACDRQTGRAPLAGANPVPQESPVEPDLTAYPDAPHRISNGRFVCDGDEKSRCHRYPSCDHEEWPCGCEYVEHATCWIAPWITAGDLADSYVGSQVTALSDDEFPDGVLEWTWEGEYLTWTYADESADPLAGVAG